MKKIHDFIIQFPMKTGYWTDGHTDTDVNSNTYKSNMSASNMVLYLLDHPAFDPEYKTDIPKLIRWTDTNFVMHSAPGNLLISGELPLSVNRMDSFQKWITRPHAMVRKRPAGSPFRETVCTGRKHIVP